MIKKSTLIEPCHVAELMKKDIEMVATIQKYYEGEMISEKLEHEKPAKQLRESLKKLPVDNKSTQDPLNENNMIMKDTLTKLCHMADIRNEVPGKNNPAKLLWDTCGKLPVNEEVVISLSNENYLIMKSTLTEHCHMAEMMKRDIEMVATIQEVYEKMMIKKINTINQRIKGFFLIPLKNMIEHPIKIVMKDEGYIDHSNENQLARKNEQGKIYDKSSREEENTVQKDQNKLEADMPVILLKKVFGHSGYLKPAERLPVDTTGSGMMLGLICSEKLIVKNSYNYLSLKTDSLLENYLLRSLRETDNKLDLFYDGPAL
jgi:hypothetical protein